MVPELYISKGFHWLEPGNSHWFSNSWARYSHTSPSFSSQYSTEQPYLHLSITAVLIYFPVSLSLCLMGACSLKIYIFSPCWRLSWNKANIRHLGFKLRHLTKFGCINEQKQESRETGKLAASREHANRKLSDYVHGCKISKRIWNCLVLRGAIVFKE